MKILKSFILSIALIILNQGLGFLIALLFPSHDQAKSLMLYFLISAIPMGLITFLFAKLLKLKTMKASMIHSCIWSLFLLLFFLLIGIGNQTLPLIFLRPSFYIMVLFTFLGPLLSFIKIGTS